MTRRDVLAMAVTTPVLPALAARIDTSKVRTRKAGKVEIVFKTPKQQPNGLQATKEGLWIIDQGRDGNWAHLVTYDGKVIKGFETETMASSGITFDGEALWIGSTYSREEVKTDANTGKALSRRFTPGAGVIYALVGDAKQRSSPVPQEMRQGRPPAAGRGQGRGQAGGMSVVQGSGFQPMNMAPRDGTGAHGQEWRDGKLWITVPPSRMVYRINPDTWVVENQWPVVGNRPHGIAWEGRFLWVTDSNLNAFHKHDPETGQLAEMIQLDDKDPLPHGMTIWDGYMWYCDDVGIVCRFKM
jgi:sugar lactone lactonase YvrE